MKSVKINLLPGAARFRLSQIKLARKLKRVAYLILGLWLAVGIATFGLKAFLGYQKKKLVARKRQLEAAIRELSPQIELQQALRFRLKITAGVLQGRSSVAEKIKRLEAALPEGTVIQSLKIKGGAIGINGRVPQLTSLVEFERELVEVAQEYYPQAKIVSLSKKEADWVFILELKEAEE